MSITKQTRKRLQCSAFVASLVSAAAVLPATSAGASGPCTGNPMTDVYTCTQDGYTLQLSLKEGYLDAEKLRGRDRRVDYGLTVLGQPLVRQGYHNVEGGAYERTRLDWDPAAVTVLASDVKLCGTAGAIVKLGGASTLGSVYVQRWQGSPNSRTFEQEVAPEAPVLDPLLSNIVDFNLCAG